MSVELILTLVFAALILANALAYRSYRRITHEPVMRERESTKPFTQPSGIEPTDPMVICPSCRGMGNHWIELVPAKPPAPARSFTDSLGDRIDVFTWQSAAGTAEHYRRECVFCGHSWTVPMPVEN